MCAFCIPGAFAGRAPRAVFLNSPVSLCLLPVTLPGRTKETIFHSPYTLPSSVSCKSCICHSFENCRGVGGILPNLENLAPCRRRKLAFVFLQFQTLCAKHPGAGVGKCNLLGRSSAQSLSEGRTEL